MHSPFRHAVALTTALSLVGCAALPQDRAYRETGELVQIRLGTAPSWPTDGQAAPAHVSDAALGPADAVRLALQQHPRVLQAYAKLGIGHAELDEARRIGNPSFGFARLSTDGHGSAQIVRSLSLGLTDVLLLPSRKRLAAAELERLQHEVAAELLEFASEVETAWYEAASAQQIAAMREIVAHAAEQSAALAQRFFDAGNIHRLQLEQERAAASRARIAAVRAAADAQRARSALAGLIGQPLDGAWTLQAQLPEPLAVSYDPDQLVERALQQRVDLAAARQALALREDALGVTRRWRWLGEVEVEYERENEGDERLRGPALSLQLPIFNQGQGAVARAQAELSEARAELDALLLSVRNEAKLGVQQLMVARDIAERYRTALVPQLETIVARSQERVNYMLMGVFELILAKQEEYDAYQEYLEAVRDYWIARAALRRVVGGALPDDASVPAPSIGVEAILPSPEAPAMDHSHHHHGHGEAQQSQQRDPHAEHRGHSQPPADPAPESNEHESHEHHMHQHHEHGGTP